MKRVIIWGGSILLLIVLVFVGLIVVLPFVLDPNDYKEQIENLVYEKSGYQLKIPGDIDFQITPGLDVLFSMGQIQVQSGAEFPDVTLLSSKEARVALSLMPLLREKRLAIEGIKLHDVYCYLIRNKNGRGNWEVSTKSVPEEATDKQPQPKQQQQQKKSPQNEQKKGQSTTLPALDIGSLDLSGISVRYEDHQTNKRFELKDFSVQTGRVQDGQPFHLQSAFTLISSANSNAALSVHSELESDVEVTLADKTVGLKTFSLNSKIKGFGVQETELNLALDAFLDLAKKDISLQNVNLKSGSLTIQLEADVVDFSNPKFKGSLAIPEFSLRQFLDDNKLSQPLWKDDSALTQVGFSCTFTGNTKKITVSDMDVILDDAKAKGSFELLDPKHPSYDFTMHVDHLDLDRYATSPPVAKTKTSETTTSPEQPDNGQATLEQKEPKTAAAPAPALFPVEMLKNLKFKLDLGADSIKVKGAHLSRVELKASGNGGLLQLKPLQAELYGGSISAESTLDVRGKSPQLKLQNKLDHVQIGPLLNDMTGKEEITGTAVVSLQVQSLGNTKKQLMRNANGKMNLSFDDGVIQKLHILQVIRQAKALYEGELAMAAAADEPTGFAHISATGVIKDGVLRNNDLKATSDLMKVTGSGKVDLGEEYVDYLLNVSLLRALDRDKKTGQTDFSKYVIPYRIKGKFSELKEEADIVGLLKSQAQNLLLNELQRQLNKHISNEKTDADTKNNGTKNLLEEGLKSLFGN